MSASQAKASVREIRRALGPMAVQALRDQDQAVAILQSSVLSVQHAHAEFLLGYAQDKHNTLDALQAVAKEVIVLQGWRDRGLWGRLSWLVRGV